MTRLERIDQMIKRIDQTLSLAGTYAGDGSIETAIELTEKAMSLLYKERRRRAQLLKRIADRASRKGRRP